jgi:hypothetical protein
LQWIYLKIDGSGAGMDGWENDTGTPTNEEESYGAEMEDSGRGDDIVGMDPPHDVYLNQIAP